MPIFKALVHIVKKIDTDKEILDKFFQCLFTMFTKGKDIEIVRECFERNDGLDLLEELQQKSRNDEVIDMCQSFIKEFIGEEDNIAL